MLEDYDSSYHQFTSPIAGLICVGAGAVNGFSSAPARSRCYFMAAPSAAQQSNSSNYGVAVTLQGWGQWVEAAGQYNDGISPTGGSYETPGDMRNNDVNSYTEGFNGTSAATPIVAGAVALFQAASITKRSKYLKPNQLQKKLVLTGASQVESCPDLGFAPAPAGAADLSPRREPWVQTDAWPPAPAGA